MSTGAINAQLTPGVQVGTCVVLNGNGQLVYAGPIGFAPSETEEEGVMLLSAVDFENLRSHCASKRH